MHSLIFKLDTLYHTIVCFRNSYREHQPPTNTGKWKCNASKLINQNTAGFTPKPYPSFSENQKRLCVIIEKQTRHTLGESGDQVWIENLLQSVLIKNSASQDDTTSKIQTTTFTHIYSLFKNQIFTNVEASVRAEGEGSLCLV